MIVALPRSLMHVQVKPLGGSYVAYSPVSGAVALLNVAARAALVTLREAGTRRTAIATLAEHWNIPARHAGSHVERLIEEWTQAGLLATARRQPPRRTFNAEARRHWSWQMDCTYGRRAICCRSTCPEAGAILERVLSTVAVPIVVGASRPAAEVCIDIVRSGDTYVIESDGRSVYGEMDFASARHMFLRALIVAQHDEGRVGAVLHAGAVAISGRAVVIAGDTGSGKSTLLASLVCAGARYLSDDLVGIDRQGRSVHPFPVRISLKSGSARLLAGVIAAERDLLLAASDGYGLAYLDASSRAARAVPHAVGLLCFPRYDPSCDRIAVDPVSPTEALKVLLETGSRMTGTAPTIAPLAKLLCQVPALALRYGDRAQAMAVIRERLT